MKFGRWLNQEDHQVEEPLFITKELRHKISKTFLLEKEKCLEFIENHDFSVVTLLQQEETKQSV